MIVHPRLAEARFRQGIHPLLESPAAFEKAGIRFVSYSFPVLIVALEWRTLKQWPRLHVDASDYDYRALQGWWVDENDNPLLQGFRVVPSGQGFQPGSPPCGAARTWFCFRGWRDWHDHSGHGQEVAWPALRGQSQFKPLALIHQLHSDLNRSGVIPV